MEVRTTINTSSAFFGHFINGEWITDQNTIPVVNKYTYEQISRIGSASRKTVTEAVTNALHTFQTKKLDSN